jgi:hypothetical protein
MSDFYRSELSAILDTSSEIDMIAALDVFRLYPFACSL